MTEFLPFFNMMPGFMILMFIIVIQVRELADLEVERRTGNRWSTSVCLFVCVHQGG